MNKTPYQRKLANPLWQKKRLEIFERDKFTCKSCYGTESELHVHHRYYLTNVDPWDYPDDCYMTLCYQCHITEESELKENAQYLLQMLKESGCDSISLLQLGNFFKGQPTNSGESNTYINSLYLLRSLNKSDPDYIRKMFSQYQDLDEKFKDS